MKKLSIIVLTILLWASVVSAQEEETLFGVSGIRLSGVWGGPVFGVSFMGGDAYPTRGSFWGLEFSDVILAGIGNERTFGSVPLKEGERTEYDFKHRGFYVRFYPSGEKVVHPVFGFMMGGGDLKDDVGEEDKLFVVQPTAGLEINIFKWWKIGLDGGYRFVSRVDLPNLSDEDLSALFFNLKLRFGFSW